MTVGELRELLDGLDDDMKVELQTQPNYPLKSKVSNLSLRSDIEDDVDDKDDVLYICEGSQIGYGDKDAWQ